MRRIQAFEFHELARCPRFLRESVVETLGEGLRRLDLGAILGPAFADFCERAQARHVLDLCSGSGAPLDLLVSFLRDNASAVPTFTLSDLYPDVPAFERVAGRHPRHVGFLPAPVDACAVPTTLEHDARVIINAFHHFSPDRAKRILADAVASQKSILLYEGFPRDLARFLPTGPATVPPLFTNPWTTTQRRGLKALFTYALPVIPAVAAWDGVVSVLRIHAADELAAMTREFDHYAWEYRELPYGHGGRATVFTGIPRERLAS